jgi:hypothetical protein
MSEKRDKPIMGPESSRSEIAECINNAFKSGDIVAICQAIGDATRATQHFRHCQKSQLRTNQQLSSLWGPAISQFFNRLERFGCDGLSA